MSFLRIQGFCGVLAIFPALLVNGCSRTTNKSGHLVPRFFAARVHISVTGHARCYKFQFPLFWYSKSVMGLIGCSCGQLRTIFALIVPRWYGNFIRIGNSMYQRTLPFAELSLINLLFTESPHLLRLHQSEHEITGKCQGPSS